MPRATAGPIGLQLHRSRVKKAEITSRGKAATDAIDAAREKMAEHPFRDWTTQDFGELIRLMRMLADGMSE